MKKNISAAGKVFSSRMDSLSKDFQEAMKKQEAKQEAKQAAKEAQEPAPQEPTEAPEAPAGQPVPEAAEPPIPVHQAPAQNVPTEDAAREEPREPESL